MLQIDSSQEKDVLILKPVGELDGQTYQDLISKAQQVYNEGAKNLILDLSELKYVSSAGLVAIHFIALLARGEALPDTENGWAALKSAERSRVSGIHKNVKLLNPQADVLKTLDMVGFTTFFEIFDDKQKAIDSF